MKQIFIINKDLKMGVGKIATQVAHGEVLYIEHIKEIESDCFDVNENDDKKCSSYIKWREFDIKPIGTMTKIVLKASENEMNKIHENLDNLNILHFKVFDLGKTQVNKGSFTCICVEPLEEVITDKLFGHLNLL